MDQDVFFSRIRKQLEDKLPFVVYSRPINNLIKCWLQHSDFLHITSSFEECGFVFSPFNLDEPSILFPEIHSDYHAITVENFNIGSLHSKSQPEESLDELNHKILVEKGIDRITKHEFKKVVLSRQIQIEYSNEDPIHLFKKLFSLYKNAMVYCWYHPKVGLWLGATPELLFKVERSKLTTISLAGTLKVENDFIGDWTHKEKEEQQIVTEFISSQIAPFSKKVVVSEPETTRAGSLAHLKTRVIADLKHSDSNLKSIIEALHPTPAVCGYPKHKVKRFILENEGYDRSYYTGFLGELNLYQKIGRNTNKKNVENSAYAALSKQTNLYVNLRCMQIINNKILIYVGGGITAASDPHKEWLETVAKAETILRIL